MVWNRISIQYLLFGALPALSSSQWTTPAFFFPQNIDGPQQFNISVDPQFIKSTQKKVELYRPTKGMSSNWSNEGPPMGKIIDVTSYWADTYDWNITEAEMNNQYQHYATAVSVDGFNFTDQIPLHFVHESSQNSSAIPLLFIHGWPSSHLEWSKVISNLTSQQTFGQAPEELSFHIVAPDLPGFGFSPAPEVPGLDPRVIGAAFDALMHQLGYATYGVASTDLGWEVGSWMACDFEGTIIGHITDFFAAQPTQSDLARISNDTASYEEKAYVRALDLWQDSHAAYATVHTQKPLAISLALTDSPIGFLGWIWDLMHTSSNGYEYGPEELITSTMMLWIQPPYANIRTYLEFNKPDLLAWPMTTTPTGVVEWGWEDGPFPSLARFPLAPKTWVERTVPLMYFQQEPFGGHFPAVTHPELWSQHVKQFFCRIGV